MFLNKKKYWIVLALSLSLVTKGYAKQERFYITKDYEKGVEIAKSFSMPIVLIFSGGNWCFYSKKFQEKILSKQDFIDEIKKKFIFIEVDFSDDFSRIKGGSAEKNYLLKEKFHVQDFPTLIVLDQGLSEVSRLGYTEEIPCEYAKRLVGIWNKYDFLLQEVKNASQAQFQKLKHLYQECKELGSCDLACKVIELGMKNDKDLFFHLESYQMLSSDERLKMKEKIMSLSLDKQEEMKIRVSLIDLPQADRIEQEKIIRQLKETALNLKNKGFDCTQISAHLDAWIDSSEEGSIE